VALHRRGSTPMRGEREAQELRNGIHLAPSFPPHWPALLARERYLRLKIRAAALSLLPPASDGTSSVESP
jgi:hypothetical protein